MMTRCLFSSIHLCPSRLCGPQRRPSQIFETENLTLRTLEIPRNETGQKVGIRWSRRLLYIYNVGGESLPRRKVTVKKLSCKPLTVMIPLITTTSETNTDPGQMIFTFAQKCELCRRSLGGSLSDQVNVIDSDVYHQYT